MISDAQQIFTITVAKQHIPIFCKPYSLGQHVQNITPDEHAAFQHTFGNTDMGSEPFGSRLHFFHLDA